jgi:hypothetical protein
MFNLEDILLLFILIYLSALISRKMGKAFGLRWYLSLGLFVWHTAFCFVYWYLAQFSIADANTYYNKGLSGVSVLLPGTRLVETFTSFFAAHLGFSKFNTYLIFNMFGVAGLLMLAQVLLSLWPVCSGWRKNIPYFMLFMPGINFWSSAIGKDAPAFFAVCLATYASLDISRRKTLLVLAFFVMFAVRPHVAAFMLLAAGISALSSSHIGLISRISIFIIVVIASVYSAQFVINYVGLDGRMSVLGVADYLESKQDQNMEGGGAIDISVLSLPLQMFAYLFRPLFFDANGYFGILASIENIFFLFIFVIFLWRYVLQLLFNKIFVVRFNVIFLFVGLIVFSITTANLGIALRQKTMIMPSIFLLIAISASQFKAKQGERRYNI